MLIKSDLQYMYILHVDRGKINDFVYMYGTFKVRIAYKYQIHVHLIRTSGRYRVIYLRGCMPSISQIAPPLFDEVASHRSLSFSGSPQLSFGPFTSVPPPERKLTSLQI